MSNKAKCPSPDPQAYKVKIFGIGLYGQYFGLKANILAINPDWPQNFNISGD